MDSNNLATLFAPNILHSMKPGDGTISPGDTKQHQIFLGKNNLTLNFNQPTTNFHAIGDNQRDFKIYILREQRKGCRANGDD